MKEKAFVSLDLFYAEALLLKFRFSKNPDRSLGVGAAASSLGTQFGRGVRSGAGSWGCIMWQRAFQCALLRVSPQDGPWGKEASNKCRKCCMS